VQWQCNYQSLFIPSLLLSLLSIPPRRPGLEPGSSFALLNIVVIPGKLTEDMPLNFQAGFSIKRTR